MTPPPIGSDLTARLRALRKLVHCIVERDGWGDEELAGYAADIEDGLDDILELAAALQGPESPVQRFGAVAAQTYKGHIDPDCEVYRGVGGYCTCETPEEKAERESERAEIEAEQDAETAPPAGGLLAKAVADRDRRPWRDHKLDYEVLRDMLDQQADKIAALESAAVLQGVETADAPPEPE